MSGSKPPRSGGTHGRSVAPKSKTISSIPPAAATIVIVDPDRVSRRFVELALQRIEKTNLEQAKDAAGALEILRTTQVDLVIAETSLPDMNGMQFHSRLAQESRYSNLPFIFLSADNRIATKVVALDAGVDDYLTKPCDGAELLARARALMRRQQRMRAAFRRRNYALAGEFAAIPFVDLIAILEVGKRTGTLAIMTPRAMGELLLSKGQVVHASLGSLAGEPAFYQLVGETSGHFEFLPGQPILHGEGGAIERPVNFLIMEAARILDEGPPAPRSSRNPDNVPEPRVQLLSERSSPRVAVPRPPDADIAAQLDQGMRDGFTLGELRVWNSEELSAWTRAEGGRDRFHVHLIAHPPAGISALLPLSGSPTEQWVLGAMRAEEKALGVAFYLRHERLLDVVLVDICNAGRFRESLARRPSLVVIAPPDGDFLSVGTKPRIELAGLFERLMPTAVLAVGNDALAGNLKELPPFRRPAFPLKFIRGALGEGRADSRALLTEGIRLWGSAPEASGTAPATTASREGGAR
jgi:CheY-like chemotaxis protein